MRTIQELKNLSIADRLLIKIENDILERLQHTLHPDAYITYDLDEIRLVDMDNLVYLEKSLSKSGYDISVEYIFGVPYLKIYLGGINE